jgi:hypothetical protein
MFSITRGCRAFSRGRLITESNNLCLLVVRSCSSASLHRADRLPVLAAALSARPALPTSSTRTGNVVLISLVLPSNFCAHPGLFLCFLLGSCNRKSNQQNLGTIRSSNLCTEILEFTSPDEVRRSFIPCSWLPSIAIYGSFPVPHCVKCVVSV